MGKRERWAALAGAILLTIALPIAIDQGYFRYNPYLLPSLGAAAAVLYVGFAATAPISRNRLLKLISWRPIVGPLLCIGLFALVGAFLGTGYWLALQASKQHVNAERGADKSSNSPINEQQENQKTPIVPAITATSTATPSGAATKGHPLLLADPIGHLSALGWTVKRDSGLLSFEVMGKTLPSMVQSAEYFRQIREPFRLSLQQVPNIDGMEHMAGIDAFRELGLSASELTSIPQLAGLKSLRKLEISQVPLNTRADIDSAPLAGLTNLTSLVLNGSRISDLSPVEKMPELERLIIEGTLIRDLSPARGLQRIKVLDIRESRITDLSPASGFNQLEELTIDTSQVATLHSLAQLPNLHKLTLIGQLPSDLSPIGDLAHLTSLFVWGPPFINLDFLPKLQELTDLQISGFGAPIGPRSQVTGSEFLCAGGKLKTLAIGALQISSLAFAPHCKVLTELNLRDIPLASLNDLSVMPSLKKVSLIDVPIVEVSPLLGLPNLESLSLIRVPARADVIALLERKGVTVTNP